MKCKKILLALTWHIWSWKTTATQYIASKLSAHLMISDKHRRSITKSENISQFQANTSPSIKQRIKNIRETEISLLTDTYIVIDSCLTSAQDRIFLKKIAEKNWYSVVFVQITSEENLIKERIEQRKIDDRVQFNWWTFEGYLKQRDLYQPYWDDDIVLKILNTWTKDELYKKIDSILLPHVQ